jgi:hypothetical protein
MVYELTPANIGSHSMAGQSWVASIPPSSFPMKDALCLGVQSHGVMPGGLR